MIRIVSRLCSVFLLTGLLTASVSAAEFPRPSGYVNDFAGIFSQTTVAYLENILTELEQKTGDELAVVTVTSTHPSDVDTYATELFENWGIGKKGRDNGILVLLSTEEKRIRIEVGYGLEGSFPDSAIGEVLDRFFIPSFKKGDLQQGMVTGVTTLAGLVAGNRGVQLSGEVPAVTTQNARQNQSAAGIIFKILFFVVLVFLFIRYPELFLMLLLMSGGHGRSRSGYGGSFGNFGGGFGGFGGGISGGGGASRGW